MTDAPITAASATTLAGAARARVALLFGGSGQIGERLLQGLLATGWQVHAFSRTPQPPRDGLHWHVGELSQLQAPPVQAEAIFSCGPLDAFADWYRRTPLPARRVVAFGSTSLEVKRDSLDAAERDVARRLREAEAALFASAAERGAAATVLRPTLVYGAGRDRTLSAIATLAQRSGWFVLPHIVELMLGFTPAAAANFLDATTYYDFVLKLVLAVGVAFVLPVFLVLLNFVGVLSAAAIIKAWRVAILVIVLFTAIATPAADIVSMFVLAIPMVVLYFAAYGVAWLHDRRAAKRQLRIDAELGSKGLV
jgi:nucleoside-diphosphate-sugar epimerase